MGLWRSRWAAVGAAVAVACGAGGVGLVDAGLDTGDRPVTVTVEPERILDTRVALGLTGKFQHATPRDLQVTGSVPVASGGSKTVVPADAVGVLVNVTVVLPSDAGFLSLRPAGATGIPETSTVNFFPFTIEPNSATVDLSADGKIQIWVQTGDITTGTADVLVDVVGYTIDHTHDDRYYTETEVDDLIDGITGGQSTGYEHVIVVAESGGDFTSVTAAVAAIGVDPDYPAASSTERYLVWVAPGVYEDEHVVMKPYVDIEGSGQNVTVLKSVRGAGGISPSAATVVGADNAELRKVRVEVEADAPGNWSHAIYTATSSRFTDVSAASSGGSRARGMVVAAGGSPILIDVALFASGGSVSNLGMDLFNSTATADGLFVDAFGGTNTTGVLLNNPTSEVRLENITTLASGGSSEVTGLRLDGGRATLEGFHTNVVGSAAGVLGVNCQGTNASLTILDGTASVSNDAGPARGVFGTDCGLELRNMVIDANAGGPSNGVAQGIDHFQNSTTVAADIAFSDVAIRVESTTHEAFGIQLNGNSSGAGTYGDVTDVTIRAVTQATTADLFGILHRAQGGVEYRGASIALAGAADWAYGIRTDQGVPRFDDVVITAEVEAETTVFGAELRTDSSTLTNARVRAVNGATGDLHDAVGVKSLNANDVTLTDLAIHAEAETNVWGVDLVSSTTRVVRVDARAFNTDPASGTVFGARCFGLATEIHDSILFAGSSNGGSIGVESLNCDASISDSELVGDGGGVNRGLSAVSTDAVHAVDVNGSAIIGSSNSIYSNGDPTFDMNVSVTDSSLRGGATSVNGTSTQTCLAVTHEAGGPAFLAGPAVCP